jgi:hypothetical protein
MIFGMIELIELYEDNKKKLIEDNKKKLIERGTRYWPNGKRQRYG